MRLSKDQRLAIEKLGEEWEISGHDRSGAVVARHKASGARLRLNHDAPDVHAVLRAAQRRIAAAQQPRR